MTLGMTDAPVCHDDSFGPIINDGWGPSTHKDGWGPRTNEEGTSDDGWGPSTYKDGWGPRTNDDGWWPMGWGENVEVMDSIYTTDEWIPPFNEAIFLGSSTSYEEYWPSSEWKSAVEDDDECYLFRKYFAVYSNNLK